MSTTLYRSALEIELAEGIAAGLKVKLNGLSAVLLGVDAAYDKALEHCRDDVLDHLEGAREFLADDIRDCATELRDAEDALTLARTRALPSHAAARAVRNDEDFACF